MVWIAFWTVNTYPEFRVNIFSNNRDITKCQKKAKSNKGHNSEKISFELFSLIVWIGLWIVNTRSKFQVNIFRDITKCQSFCTTMPTLKQYLWIISENSRAKSKEFCWESILSLSCIYISLS